MQLVYALLVHSCATLQGNEAHRAAVACVMSLLTSAVCRSSPADETLVQWCMQLLYVLSREGEDLCAMILGHPGLTAAFAGAQAESMPYVIMSMGSIMSSIRIILILLKANCGSLGGAKICLDLTSLISKQASTHGRWSMTCPYDALANPSSLCRPQECAATLHVRWSTALGCSWMWVPGSSTKLSARAFSLLLPQWPWPKRSRSSAATLLLTVW